MRRVRLAILFLSGCAILLPAGVGAQTPKVARVPPGKLNGEVVDAQGTPVAGARIMWQASDGGVPRILQSDSNGRFQIPHIRSGLYELRASVGETQSEWAHNVSVRPGVEVSVTLQLSPKPAAAAVRVPVVELNGLLHTWDAPVPGSLPGDSAIDPKGNVWFSLQQTGHIARFNPDTHEWKLFKVPTPDSAPDGLVSDAAGNIWFTESATGKIGRWDAKTEAISEFTSPSAKDVHTPAIGPDGSLWFTAQKSNFIGQLDVVTGKITEYSVPTQNANPYGMVLASDGGLWFCELTGGKLGRIDPKTLEITEYAPPLSDVRPRRLARLGDAIYFTDSAGGRLGRITLNDKKFKLWDSPSGKDSEPYGIAADTAGKIWYQEGAGSANKLVRFDPTVEVFTPYPMPEPNSSVPNIARDARGHLWMPLSASNKIMLVE